MPNIIASILMLVVYAISIRLMVDLEVVYLWVIPAVLGMWLSTIALVGQVRTYLANNNP